MRTIRASEIGTYMYCQRAWWYQINGHKPQNEIELTSGQEIHRLHNRQVAFTGCLRWVAYALILGSMVGLTITLGYRFF